MPWKKKKALFSPQKKGEKFITNNDSDSNMVRCLVPAKTVPNNPLSVASLKKLEIANGYRFLRRFLRFRRFYPSFSASPHRFPLAQSKVSFSFPFIFLSLVFSPTFIYCLSNSFFFCSYYSIIMLLFETIVLLIL